MEKLFFTEEQKFRSTFVWLIMFPVWAIVNIVFGIGLYKQLGLGQPWGDEPMPDTGLIIVTIAVNLIVIGSALLMLKTKMIIEIRESGLFYRYPPFIIKEKKISQEEIERYEVRQYKPIREYGGWGFRQRKRGFHNAGLAYNVSGNIGLQLYLKNGKKILFGTQRKEAIGSAIKKLMGGKE
jgi:hypothetical protein